jgi:hypothetical protein
MTKIEYLDRPPSGWFPLDVMMATPRKWDWCALMVDVDPDDLKHCVVEFPALFYVHPDNYRPGEGKRSNDLFAFRGSIGLRMLLGLRWRTWSRRGTIAGKPKKWRGNLTGVDMHKTLENMQQSRDDLLRRANFPMNVLG